MKKLLSIILALAMLAGLGAVGASAGAYDGLTEAEQAELFALKIEMVLNGMWYNLWDPGAWSGATPIKDPNLRSTTLKNTEKYL